MEARKSVMALGPSVVLKLFPLNWDNIGFLYFLTNSQTILSPPNTKILIQTHFYIFIRNIFLFEYDGHKPFLDYFTAKTTGTYPG